MKKILFVLLPIFLFTVSLDANETTARIKGNVNIGGAEVTAVHVPTNISKTTTASESGSFNLSFLPIGGPYKVTVSKAGYVAQVITIPLLTSADPAKVSVSLITTPPQSASIHTSRRPWSNCSDYSYVSCNFRRYGH